MEVGDGIEVLEGEEFARVMLPVQPPALGFVRGKRFETWVAVIFGVMCLFMPVGLALSDGDHFLRLFQPRDGFDVMGGVMSAMGILMLECFMVFGVLVMRKLFYPGRAIVVVDRHGVRAPMIGPLDGWRIKAALIRAVAVVGSREKGGRGGEGEGKEFATVRFEAGRKSGSVGGRYSREEAMAAARIFSKEIERVSGVVVGVRDMLDGMASGEDEESVLRSGGVGIEKVGDGVRLCLGNHWSLMKGNVDTNYLLMSAIRGRWWLLAVLVSVVVGFVLPERFQEAAGIYVGVIFLLGLAWMVDAMFSRVSYTVGEGGLEREIVRLGRWKRCRRWGREEIKSVFVVAWSGSGGRNLIAGVIFMDGRRMPMVVGGRLTVGVFAGVLGRGLGVGVDEVKGQKVKS